jgi:hypothetical protein
MPWPRLQLEGRMFGRLKVLRFAGMRNWHSYWLCQCQCGREKIISAKLLKMNVQSCGCLRSISNFRHGHNLNRKKRSRTYRIWANMKQRCSNQKNPRYADWGGRGIHICERWNIFSNFLADMGECPSKLTIDRIDNDGNYELSNCRWATMLQQRHNRRISK